MIIKYKYSPLLFIDTLHAPIPVLFFIWFFFGHKGTDASHPLMLILALWMTGLAISYWLFKLFITCQKLWKKDYLSIKGDHI